MREILFRGKRIDNGEWVEGFYVSTRDIVSEELLHIIVRNPADSCGCEIWDFETVDPKSISQFTGCYDKNGKRIFEGDIVYYSCSDISAVVKFGQYIDVDSPNKPAIGFYSEYSEDGKIAQESMDSRECDEEYGCEVIGNATDNPELLEVRE